MPWNSLSPDGSKSVKQNTTPMQQNTAFTEVELNKDHFWNIGIDQNGHHRFAQMESTNDANKTLPTNAVLATAMDLVYYNRFKTPVEAIDLGAQNAQPYAISDPGSKVLQLLGIRAMVLFTVAGGVPTIRYHHNIKPIAGTPATDGVERISAGRFAIRFAINLPSNDYLVCGGAQKNAPFANAEPINACVGSGPGLGNGKAVHEVSYLTFLPDGTKIDPFECWLICFGG